jgi:hypothetical protein
MKKIDKELYDTLSDAPRVPDTLYPSIERRLRPRVSVVWALAAGLILAIGATAFYMSVISTKQTAPVAVAAPALSDDVINDLQTLRDFANGNNIDIELAMYSIADGE